MGTRYVKYAPENEVAAEACSAFIDTNLPVGLTPFAWRWEEDYDIYTIGQLKVDTNGNWVVAWPFDGPFEIRIDNVWQTIPTPEGADVVLELGIIVDSPDWIVVP